jgi:chromosome segregation ATPase
VTESHDQACEWHRVEVIRLRDALATARDESNQLRAGLVEANSVIDGYSNDESQIVRGALDAQAEAERMYYEIRAEAVQLRSERDYLKASLEQLTKERDHLKSAYALAKCSWCDEPVCEQHAAPGEHPGCGRPRST